MTTYPYYGDLETAPAAEHEACARRRADRDRENRHYEEEARSRRTGYTVAGRNIIEVDGDQ